MSPSRSLESSSASSACLSWEVESSSTGLLEASAATSLGLSPSSTSALNGLLARAFSAGGSLFSAAGGGVADGVGTPFTESETPLGDLMAYMGLGAGAGVGVGEPTPACWKPG